MVGGGEAVAGRRRLDSDGRESGPADPVTAEFNDLSGTGRRVWS